MLRQLLEACDVVKISDDELQPLVGTSDPEAAARALHAMGVSLAVITLGARGCYFSLGEGANGYVAGEHVTVVDTTGAGDAFMAGLLSEIMPRVADGRRIAELSPDEVRRACARGNHLGALAVTRLGATSALPTLHGV